MASKKRTLKRRTQPSTKAATQSRVKTVNRYASKLITKTKKNLKLAAKQGRLQQQRNELSYIETLLGEDFESLSQARSALKREVTTVKKSLPKTLKKYTPKALTKQAKKGILKTLKKGVSEAVAGAIKFVQPPLPPRQYKQVQPHITVGKKKSFTLRELRDGDRRNVLSYLDDKLNANALDRELLKPGEQWAAQVTYRYRGTDGKTHVGYAMTYNTFPSAYTLFKRLAGYVAKEKISENQKAAWLNQIKVIRFSGEQGDYDRKKMAEVNKQQERKKKVSNQLKRKGKK